MAQIATVGLWHLGCVVSAGLASLGHSVRGTDPDAEIVRRLQQGIPPLHESGLPELVAEQARLGRLSFVMTAREAFQDAEFIFLTFDTPVDENDGSDLGPVEAYLEQIARHARQDVTIVVMSQVPVGTCEHFSERLHRLAPHASYSLLSQPENLRLGEALATFLQPDFLLVGAEDEQAARGLLSLYEGIQTQKLVVGRNSAEMVKHTLNAFLATSISFVNELLICPKCAVRTSEKSSAYCAWIAGLASTLSSVLAPASAAGRWAGICRLCAAWAPPKMRKLRNWMPPLRSTIPA